VLVLEELLVLEEQVVHRPEAVLQPGGLGRLGSAHRVGMDLREREVPEGEEQVVAHRPLHGLHHQVCPPAEGALVVPVLQELEGRVGPPLDVVLRVQRWPQRAHDFLPCIPSRASRIPSAPGLTPIGET
jgi:hypothetical protein